MESKSDENSNSYHDKSENSQPSENKGEQPGIADKGKKNQEKLNSDSKKGKKAPETSQQTENVEVKPSKNSPGIHDKRMVEPKANKRRKHTVAIIAAVLLIALVSLFVFGKYLLIKELKKAIDKNVNGTAEIKRIEIGLSGARFEGITLKSKQGETWIKADKLQVKYFIPDILKKPYGHKFIKSADIYNPEVVLIAEKDGSWNLFTLFDVPREKREKVKLELEFPARIHDGKFRYSDKNRNNFQANARRVNGELRFVPNEWNVVDLKLNIVEDNAEAHIRGKMEPEFMGMDIRVYSTNLSVPRWMNYIIDSPAAVFHGGRITLNANISAKNFLSAPHVLDVLDISGKAFLNNGKLKLSILPDPVNNLQGKVTITKDKVDFYNIKGIYNGTPLEVNGSLINLKSLIAKIYVRLPEVVLETMKKQPLLDSVPFSLSGKVSAEVGISGHLHNPVIDGRVKFDSIKAKDETVKNGEAQFLYLDKMAQVELIKSQWGDGSVHGMGCVYTGGKHPRFMAEMKGNNADVGRFAKIFFPDYKIEATSDFNIKIMGTAQDPLIVGKSSFSGVRYSNSSLGSGTANFIYNNQVLLLNNFNLQKDGGNISGTSGLVDIQNKYLDLGIDARNFDFPTEIIPSLKDVKFRSNAVGRVLGYFTSPIVRGIFSEASIDYKGKQARNSSGSIFYSNNFVYLKDGAASIDNTDVKISGWSKFDKQITGQMVYSSNSILLSHLGSLVPSFRNLRSKKKVDIEGFVSGENNDFSWTITGDGSLGNLAGFGKFNYSNNSRFTANMLGWGVDMNEFIPPDQQKLIKPETGDFLIQATGNPNNFTSNFITRTEKGKAMGVPVNISRGTLTYSGGLLNFSDTFLSGYERKKGRDVRFSETNDLYRMSVYWGMADPPKAGEKTLLSRMYYMPYMLEGYTYTPDGWQMTVIKPIKIGSDSSLKNVRGLPSLWYGENFRQLKNYSDTGYPLSVTFSRKGFGSRLANMVPVFDATINGTVDPAASRLHLNVKSNNLNIEALGNKIDLSSVGISFSDIKKTLEWNRIEGTAGIDGKIIGYWTSPRWEGKIDINDGIINHESFSFNSDMQIDNQGFNFSRFQLDQSVSRYSGSGKILFKPDLNFDLALTAKDGKLERLLSFTPWKDTPARGLLSGDIKVGGNLDALRIDGDILVEQAKIYNQPLTSLSVKMKSGKNSIQLEEIKAAVNGSKITGSGAMKNSKLDFSLSSDQFSLNKLEILNNTFKKVSGDSHFSLLIKGTRNSPIFDLDFSADEFSLDNQNFKKATGKLHWENKQLTMSPLSLETIDAYWKTNGSVSFPTGSIPSTWDEWSGKKGKPPVMSINSEVKNWKLENILDLAKSPIKEKLTGTLAGNMNLTGSFPYPAFDMDLHTYNGNIDKFKYSSIDFYLRYKEGLLEMKEFEYISPGSHALLTGEINDANNQIFLTGDVKNLPVEIFHPFIPQSRFLSGNIDSATLITGDYQKPDMVSNTVVRDGKLESVDFDEVGGHLIADKGVISFDDLAIRKNNQKLSFSGKIPIEISDSGLQFPEPMDIRAKVKDKNLDVLSLFIPYIQENSGSINTNLELTGKYPNLEIKGEGHIRNGKIKLSLMDSPVEDLQIDVKFEGKQLTVPRFKGKLGDGVFNLNGYARLDEKGLEISSMKFLLLGNNLLVLMPGLVKGLVDTKVTLTGNQKYPVIGKTHPLEGPDYLTLKNATFTMPGGQLKSFASIIPKPAKKVKEMSKEEKKAEKEKTADQIAKEIEEGQEGKGSPFGFPLIYNFKFAFGDNVWLDYKGLYIKSNGNLEIYREKEQNIRIFGELDFSQGTFQMPFMTTAFQVNKGVAYFHGGDPVKYDKDNNPIDYMPNPDFSMEARAKMSDVDVYMTYNGNLEDLKDAFSSGSSRIQGLDIYSLPPLPREAIVELLVSSTVLGSIVDPSATTGRITDTNSMNGTALNMLANYLQGVLLTPITRKFGQAFQLSELFFQVGAAGTWTFRMAKALDPNERFFITYSQAKRIQGNTVGIWGLEYKYRPGMRIRVENEEDAFTYMLQGYLIFDNFNEFVSQVFDLVKPARNRTKRK